MYVSPIFSLQLGEASGATVPQIYKVCAEKSDIEEL